ncbi:MAG: tetratricopeptide repeat protein [Parvularculaceae bacterium]|nr:tetratricopeptide repeat protein [Parvularculaceae bacterium]
MEFEISGAIEIEKSSLVICSEGAASGDNLESALEACNDAIEEEPTDGDAYYFRGVVNSQLGKDAAAEDDFTSAIELGANRLAEAYYWRGVSKENQRKLRDAANDFQKAAELKPQWSAAQRKVAEYHWALN